MSDLLDLSGQRAFVTGAAKGIGAAVARRLAEFGATVIVSDIDAAVDDIAAEIGGTGVRCDITDADDVASALDVAADGLDIVVNNAGIYPTTGPIASVADDFVARMLDVNVRAQFSLTREAAARMPNGGSIINFASIAALRGGPGISAYAASKAAVVSLTRSAAMEYGPLGIRVNAIAPGIIDTPGVQAQMEPLKAGGLDIDKAIAANPLGIAGQPDHIAKTVLYLVSGLADFVTGQTIVVDGGATA